MQQRNALDDFEDTLGHVARISASTDALLIAALMTDTFTLTTQMTQESKLKVEISGANGLTLALVNIDGNTDETLTFTGNDFHVTDNEFTSVTQITVSGATDGTIHVTGFHAGGQPVYYESVKNSSAPCLIANLSAKEKMQLSGLEKPAEYRALFLQTESVSANDFIEPVSGTAGLTRAQLINPFYVFDFDGNTHHIESLVKRL